MHSLASHRYRRIEESPAAVLSKLSDTTQLYVHARNWMAEMAVITPLTDSFTGDEGWLSFPEQGLNLSLPAIQHLHSVSIDHHSRPSLALEVATHGEPRSISFAAIPVLSDISAFRDSLASHPSQHLSSDQYEAWRSGHLIRPTACACCAGAAETRRRDPGNSPLARIFTNAIETRRALHCRLHSNSFRFALTFTPGDILLNKGHIGLTGDDSMSMLEIDPGLCHSLMLHRKEIDAEPMTILRVYNSLGVPELIIETSGFEAHDEWLEFCRPS